MNNGIFVPLNELESNVNLIVKLRHCYQAQMPDFKFDVNFNFNFKTLVKFCNIFL